MGVTGAGEVVVEGKERLGLESRLSEEGLDGHMNGLRKARPVPLIGID